MVTVSLHACSHIMTTFDFLTLMYLQNERRSAEITANHFLALFEKSSLNRCLCLCWFKTSVIEGSENCCINSVFKYKALGFTISLIAALVCFCSIV